MMEAILFDLDGTILNSRDSHYRVFREVGDRLNVKNRLTMEQFLDWYSPNYFQLFSMMGIDESNWPRASQIWRAYCHSHEKPELFPDAIGVLTYLKTRYPLALVTGGSVERVDFDLARRKIRDFFTVVVYGEGLPQEELKPAAKQLQMALEELNKKPENDMYIRPENAVYVGDTPPDVQAGKNAGMMTIAVNANPFSTLEKIKQSNPDRIIDSLEELKRIF